MSFETADRVDRLDPSGIRRFFEIAAEREDVISLGVGEPDYAPPAAVSQATIDSLEQDRTAYTANRGMRELRERLASYVSRYGLSPDPEAVLVTAGASEALDLAMRALVDPGDTVAVPQPGYVSYEPAVSLAGGSVVPVPTEPADGFRLTVDGLSAAGAAEADLLVLCYPNNPTGATMTDAELEPIAEFVREHDLGVISDEIYAELTYGHEHASIASIEGMADRTVVINGFSKAFAMTGFRLGYAIGPPSVIDAMNRIHQYTMLSAPTQAQYAALEALESCDGAVQAMVSDYDDRRQLVADRLADLGLRCVEPRGAFYAFPEVPPGWDAATFAESLLTDAEVAVVPGTAFGPDGAGHVRLSYATDRAALTEAFDRIATFLDEHQ